MGRCCLEVIFCRLEHIKDNRFEGNLMNYKDKVVIVTGAGKGIGRAIALSYASKGAKVIIAKIDITSGKQTE